MIALPRMIDELPEEMVQIMDGGYIVEGRSIIDGMRVNDTSVPCLYRLDRANQNQAISKPWFMAGICSLAT